MLESAFLYKKWQTATSLALKCQTQLLRITSWPLWTWKYVYTISPKIYWVNKFVYRMLTELLRSGKDHWLGWINVMCSSQQFTLLSIWNVCNTLVQSSTNKIIWWGNLAWWLITRCTNTVQSMVVINSQTSLGCNICLISPYHINWFELTESSDEQIDLKQNTTLPITWLFNSNTYINYMVWEHTQEDYIHFLFLIVRIEFFSFESLNANGCGYLKITISNEVNSC